MLKIYDLPCYYANNHFYYIRQNVTEMSLLFSRKKSYIFIFLTDRIKKDSVLEFKKDTAVSTKSHTGREQYEERQ